MVRILLLSDRRQPKPKGWAQHQLFSTKYILEEGRKAHPEAIFFVLAILKTPEHIHPEQVNSAQLEALYTYTRLDIRKIFFYQC